MKKYEMKKYEGLIEPGMVLAAPGNGGIFRRDLVIAKHPTKPDLWILEALPCRMRKRVGSRVGEIFTCPEVNLRLFAAPEKDVTDAMVKHVLFSLVDEHRANCDDPECATSLSILSVLLDKANIGVTAEEARKLL